MHAIFNVYVSDVILTTDQARQLVSATNQGVRYQQSKSRLTGSCTAVFRATVIGLLNFGLLPYANKEWRHIFQILKNITGQRYSGNLFAGGNSISRLMQKNEKT